MNATKLKVNRLSAPIGMDADEIAFSWIPVCGILQTAFRLQIQKDGQQLFDSSIVSSSQTEYVPETKFSSRSRYEWSVTLWDENGKPGVPASGHFETGIAHKDWRARWIDPELNHPEYCKRATDGLPLNKASYLRKNFTVSDFQKARLYITAHGVYDAYINGKHIDGYFMAPGTGVYEKRLQVQTYDVSPFLHPGENEITVTIGEGWWRGSHGWSMFRYCYGTDLALLCQLELDGKPVVCSDESWEASQNGPLQENDTMRLERYDARRVITDWHSVKAANFGFENLIGSTVPITLQERLGATLFTAPNGQKILDFGQNIAGFVELNLEANGGEVIRLQHSDALGKDGNFQIRHFQNGDSPLCAQVVEYTCKPGKNLYHQTKCYYGFRYVLLETDLPVDGSEFTAVAVYSDMEQTGYFSCGDSLVNKLFQNTLWSMKSNFVDIPTDCPHREKLGFTGDAQIFSDTALYLMDCEPVFTRWLQEIVAAQYDNGCIPNVVPRSNYRLTPEPVGKDGSAGWCNAYEIVPWRIAERTNSDLLLKKLYPGIRRWAMYNLSVAQRSRPENEEIPLPHRNYILDTATHWGEWNEPGRGPQDYFAESMQNGHAEVATGFMAYCCLLVSKIAGRLCLKEDALFFQKAYEHTRDAYRYAYTQDGTIRSERQCHYVRAISLELLSQEEAVRAAEALARIIRENDNHIGTGFLTTAQLCNVLTDHGYADVAYDLLLQKSQPSWLFPIECGATTIWESWYSMRDGEPRSSQNHYSLGAVVGWLMSRVAGIRLENGHITIRPYPDRRLGFADATYHSPAGTIHSAWKYESNEIVFDITIPANSKATLILPDHRTLALTPGQHTYKVTAPCK